MSPSRICQYTLALAAVFFVLGPMAKGAAHAGPLSSREKSTLVWGSFLAPSSVRGQDSDNAKFELYAKTSVEIVEINKDVSLQIYTIFAAIRDSQKLDFNSKLKAGLGLELKYRLSKAVRLSFGGRFDSECRVYSGTVYSAPVATADLSLYKTWTPHWLRDRGELVVSGWANFRYPAALERAERNNALFQGSFKSSLVFGLGETDLKIAPFLSTSFKHDSKGRPWNNYIEPGLGVDLKIPAGKRGELVIGAKIVQQIRFESSGTQSGGLGYVSWYKHF